MPPKPKEKGKPTAAAAPAVAIEDLFTTLNRHVQRLEFDLAVKVSSRFLSIAPGDDGAIMCKVVALIKNDRIDEALSSIEVFSKKSSIDFSFFKVYAMQKNGILLISANKLDEALESLKGKEGNSAAMFSESQILYRLGKMDACVDIYQNLQKSKIDSLEINFVAGLVSAGRATEVQGTMDSLRVKPTSSFELAYNETLMEENLADDDIETELAPIAVQLAYVQQGPKDVSDGLRKLDKLVEKGEGPLTFHLARGLDLKLSQKQREAIYVNRLLLLLHSNKLDQARELALAVPGMFPNSITPVLLQAAVHVRENKANRAEEILWQFANKFPDKSKIILLARAQIAASAGHPQIAAESLQRIQDIQHKPATIATLVSLKERAGDIDGADSVFDSAIRRWSNAMSENNYKLNVIMQEAASFKLRHGKKDEAARLYEELVRAHNSIEALVGLIRTAAHTDVEKAESYEKQLKPPPGLKGIDVESLDKTSGPKQIENGLSVGISEAYEPKTKEKTKKKRKRKPKYPKVFDPANPGPPPDPERWLPKRERSSFRPKRRDKRAAQIRGSQGAVAKEAASSVNSKSNQVASSKESSQTASTEQTKRSSKSRKKSRN
ncbi:hypothetical protein DH2020_001036 [Rehmannia glutinosa]|uniref:Signal recognition particle subunit SRP72 n=1 Tax=Rehmannia glutinosa TaxID=99300 RepID=A0ABR0XY68_REHGL